MFQIKSELRCLFKVPSVCRVVDVLLLFFGKRRMQNEHVHSRKHTTFRFLQPFPSFIHYSRAEYMLSRMCSQLLYPQRIFHEACQLLYIFILDRISSQSLKMNVLFSNSGNQAKQNKQENTAAVNKSQTNKNLLRARFSSKSRKSTPRGSQKGY